jgi:predicted PurR-regulated permease PerM
VSPTRYDPGTRLQFVRRHAAAIITTLMTLVVILTLALVQIEVQLSNQVTAVHHQAQAIQLESQARDAAIQAGRADSIRLACDETNQRHDDVIDKLDKLIARYPEGSVRRAQAKRNRAATVTLLEAIVPKQNCEQRVSRLLQALPPLANDPKPTG